MAEQRASYGGQAVLEGVLIRGRRCLSLAVRLGNGNVHTELLPFNPEWAAGWRRFPIARGALVLWETLSLGLRALNRSGELALRYAEGAEKHADEGVGKGALGVAIALALVIGVGFFFLLPHFLIRSLDSQISSSLLSNVLEGVLRLALLLGYLVGIGRLKDVQRLFQYHGAEHMVLHAQEHREPLEPERVAVYPTAHPRCGTAFLLFVAVVSVIVFSFLGRPDLWLSILSRIALIPVIAGVSYELLRLGGRNAERGWMRPLVLPGLALQRLTTRQPDRGQLEVAIAALSQAIQADQAAQGERPAGR
ncbi:MAG: DUF1385 domain-containing protein [Dehalococcoidia bacterium]|nr:DUF1385 domain-containing protein [Dehalococcoidia bacterium]